MKRILRILGLAMVLSALLVVSITGAVFAAGDENGKGNFQNQGEVCPCEECPCGECIYGESVLNEWDWDWAEREDPSGPHGSYKYREGKID